MKSFFIFLLFSISSTQAAEYCETEECVRLAGSMKSMMNESVDPCDDFYEYTCGNYVPNYDTEIVKTLVDNFLTLGKILETVKPNISNEKVALALLQKCVNDKSDNLDTFLKDFWDNTDDLTELIIEVTKLNSTSGGIFINDIYKRPRSSGKGHIITLTLPKTGQFSSLPWKEVESRVKFMNLTEYFYQLLPESDRRYGALDDVVLVDESFLTIDEMVEKQGKAAIKQQLYSAWKTSLKKYMENRDTFNGCLDQLVNLLPGTSTMFFLGKILKEENIETVTTIFKMLQMEANDMIEQSSWLGEDTKSAMLSKLNSVATSIGIPDELQNQTVVDAIFDRVLRHDIEKQSYLTLVRNVLIMKSEETFLEYSKLTDPTFMNSPFMPTANYYRLTHRITIGPYFIMFPFIDQNLPEWSILASFAFVVGHEIGHMFDPAGYWADEYLMPMRVDNRSSVEYIKRAECLVEKYSEFKFPGFEKHLDGRRTINENFADQFGFQLAYRLFKKLPDDSQKLPGFGTLDQQFFKKMAYTWCGKDMDLNMVQQYDDDPHSPGIFRVNGVASNSAEFAEAFGCVKSTAMNPEKKYMVWQPHGPENDPTSGWRHSQSGNVSDQWDGFEFAGVCGEFWVREVNGDESGEKV